MEDLHVIDLLGLVFECASSVDVQKAMVDAVQELIEQGVSQQLALSIVFDNNNPLNKLH